MRRCILFYSLIFTLTVEATTTRDEIKNSCVKNAQEITNKIKVKQSDWKREAVDQGTKYSIKHGWEKYEVELLNTPQIGSYPPALTCVVTSYNTYSGEKKTNRKEVRSDGIAAEAKYEDGKLKERILTNAKGDSLHLNYNSKGELGMRDSYLGWAGKEYNLFNVNDSLIYDFYQGNYDAMILDNKLLVPQRSQRARQSK